MKPKLSLDTAFQQLQDIVDQFEHGHIKLEQASEQFAKGVSLAAYLKENINQIENKIETIKTKFDKST